MIQGELYGLAALSRPTTDSETPRGAERRITQGVRCCGSCERFGLSGRPVCARTGDTAAYTGLCGFYKGRGV
jgi:hypothetical protein